MVGRAGEFAEVADAEGGFFGGGGQGGDGGAEGGVRRREARRVPMEPSWTMRERVMRRTRMGEAERIWRARL